MLSVINLISWFNCIVKRFNSNGAAGGAGAAGAGAAVGSGLASVTCWHAGQYE